MINPLPERVETMAACAAALGCSNPYLSQRKKAGVIGPEPDGSWNPRRVRALLDAAAHMTQSVGAQTKRQDRAARAAAPTSPPAPAPAPSAPPSPPAEAPSDPEDSDYGTDHRRNFEIARSRREMEEAARARIARMREEGLLVEKEVVDRTTFTLARGLRDRLMGLPTKIAPLLAPVTDAFELERKLREAIRGALNECLEATDAGG